MKAIKYYLWAYSVWLKTSIGSRNFHLSLPFSFELKISILWEPYNGGMFVSRAALPGHDGTGRFDGLPVSYKDHLKVLNSFKK